MISAEEQRQREEAVANAVQSVRLEGLDPAEAETLLYRWAHGEITDEQLDEAERRFVKGLPIDDLLVNKLKHPA